MFRTAQVRLDEVMDGAFGFLQNKQGSDRRLEHRIAPLAEQGGFYCENVTKKDLKKYHLFRVTGVCILVIPAYNSMLHF